MRRTKLSFILAVFIFGLGLAGCIALKPTGKTSYAKQVYHDITHRNNGYFNAEEKLKKVRENVTNARKDDYDKLLSVYTDRDPEVAKTYSSDLDEVIKKTSTVIQNHGPSIYTPNSYLLVGISYFLKGDFENAQLTFQYVNTEFKNQAGGPKKPEVKKTGSGKSNGKPMTAAQKAAAAKGKKGKSKKHKGKPLTALQLKEMRAQQQEEDSLQEIEDRRKEAIRLASKDTTSKNAAATVDGNKGGDDPWHWLKHEPVRPDAMIWLADTYTEMKKYKESEAVLTIIDADRQFPSWLKKDVELARTNLFLKKGDLARAIGPLSWLIEKTKSKHARARYEYILAQIYERQNNNHEAIVHFKKVLDGNPNYKMAFNTKMSFARIAMKDNSTSTAEVISLLKKLLNDNKNKEFNDQVYFALAELSLRDNREAAIGYYKKCIETSTSNTAQKSKAYLRLGELYFEDEKYVLSQPYYDSCLTLLSKDDPKKPEVNKRNSILKNLVTQVNLIHDGDSILKLSKMTDQEKELYVEEQIKKKEEEKQQKEQEQKFLLQQNSATTINPTDQTGGWYFDNTAAKGTGYNDFIKRWGSRKLEDSWRRLDKSTNSLDDKDKEAEDTATADKGGKEKLTEKEKMLKNIPSDTVAMRKANEKIVDAYYMLGTIYNIELNNPPKAVSTFDTLLTRYPVNKWQGETYYNLYLLYAKLGNTEKSEYYKNLLMSKFPDSKFANIIRDPDYLKHQSLADNASNRYYESTYQLYLQGQYDSVISRKAQADTIYKGNKMKPKLDLLEAYAIGKSKDLKSYKDALTNIVKAYPTDSVHYRAEQILKYIETTKDSSIHIQNNMSRYEYSAEARHFFLIDIKGDSVKVPDLMKVVAQYNDANRSADKLKIEPMLLPDGNTVLSIKSFPDLKKAREYYDAFTQANLLNAFPKKLISLYLISDVNMNKVIINKEINSYFDYYNTKYIK